MGKVALGFGFFLLFCASLQQQQDEEDWGHDCGVTAVALASFHLASTLNLPVLPCPTGCSLPGSLKPLSAEAMLPTSYKYFQRSRTKAHPAHASLIHPCSSPPANQSPYMNMQDQPNLVQLHLYAPVPGTTIHQR
ncbi:hypothetical protein PT974_08946 [Cladobotryum mycophilum]|uniref:Uncharacterized protein n=1 Tax=Cladobotryum mycophilum TaxID=491253 RepID=A0ABR0SFS0_9HYPO